MWAINRRTDNTEWNAILVSAPLYNGTTRAMTLPLKGNSPKVAMTGGRTHSSTSRWLTIDSLAHIN